MLSHSRSRLPLIILLLMALAAGALAWQVATRSLVAFLAVAAPDWAMALAPGNSDVLLNLAEEKLGLRVHGKYVATDEAAPPPTAKANAAAAALRAKGIVVPLLPPEISASARDQVRQWVAAALRSDPFDARALRILGQAADTEAQAASYMQKSFAHSQHEFLAGYWLLQKSYLEGDFAKTIFYADVLLRSKPQFESFIVPVLGRIAETNGGIGPIKTLLKSNPPWRRRFFYTLVSSISDARTPLTLMLDMQANGMPPTPEEVQFYLTFLMKKKFYELAYYSWAQFLSADDLTGMGLLFNGNFTSALSEVPFDWNITRGKGSRIDIVDRADKPGQKALYFEFAGIMIDAFEVKQVVTLVPGKYRLRGLQMGDIRARRGMRWQVACYDNPFSPFAESADFVGAVANWREFSFDFTVPAKNCQAQQLWLALDARLDSERIVAGSASFAELALTPKPN